MACTCVQCCVNVLFLEHNASDKLIACTCVQFCVGVCFFEHHVPDKLIACTSVNVVVVDSIASIAARYRNVDSNAGNLHMCQILCDCFISENQISDKLIACTCV